MKVRVSINEFLSNKEKEEKREEKVSMNEVFINKEFDRSAPN